MPAASAPANASAYCRLSPAPEVALRNDWIASPDISGANVLLTPLIPDPGNPSFHPLFPGSRFSGKNEYPETHNGESHQEDNLNVLDSRCRPFFQRMQTPDAGQTADARDMFMSLDCSQPGPILCASANVTPMALQRQRRRVYADARKLLHDLSETPAAAGIVRIITMGITDEPRDRPISFKNILFAMDFSAGSLRAFPFAAGIALHYGGKIFVEHIAPAEDYVAMPPAEQSSLDKLLEAAEEAGLYDPVARLREVPTKCSLTTEV